MIRKDVGSRVDIGHEDVKKYYDEHKAGIYPARNRCCCADIFLNTDGKTPDEIAVIQKKANDIRARLKNGEDFAELAKRNSEGPTAKKGGDLGAFERGQLSKQIEDTVFAMKKNDLSDVIQTKTGFEIIKVLDHYDAGQQPLEKVENEIMNHIYGERMSTLFRAAIWRNCANKATSIVKPGYIDTAAVASNTGQSRKSPRLRTRPTRSSRKKAKKAAGAQ